MATERYSQKAEILKWLQAGYTITRKESVALCNCYALPQRIMDLRRDGWLIVKERPRVKGAKYGVYRLLGRIDDYEGGVNNDTFR